MRLLLLTSGIGLAVITGYNFAFSIGTRLGFWRLMVHDLLVMAWTVVLVCAYARLAIMAQRRKQCGR